MGTRGDPADLLHGRRLQESVPSPVNHVDASGYFALDHVDT
jgi:hypothetical protein